ncbi:MAG: hypothetical protein IKJ10_02220 [Bacteroidaceae bacterium]|nr:hypothetical protein [Bacteroidaceae bacterium]
MKNYDFTSILTLSPEELRRRQKTKGWALSFVGLIVYGILRLFRCKPKDYHGICPYFEIGKGWGGLELGWFFICCKGASEHTKMHEVGHGIQNAAVGGLRMLCLSIGSALRYWKRELFGAKTPYDSWWFEGQATDLGRKYVNLIKENKNHETENHH